MEDDIDIEEHDLLKDPALRSVFPDLSILKYEIDDYEIHTETRVLQEIINKNDLDSTSVMFSRNTLVHDLNAKPNILCIDDRITIENKYASESLKENIDFHIKKEAENIEFNVLPIYRNRIILGKINVDESDEECNDDALREVCNIGNNEGNAYQMPNVAVVTDPGEDRKSKTTKKYCEKRKLAKVVLTDCHTSLLGNKCYCAQCAVLFPTTEAYCRHNTSTHDKKNGDSSKYIDHVGDKPFVCEICKKTFNRSSDLNRHKLTHTAEKPFECDICKKGFKQKQCLNNHKLIHSGEKPFECRVQRHAVGRVTMLTTSTRQRRRVRETASVHFYSEHCDAAYGVNRRPGPKGADTLADAVSRD
ncbi:unnamed protein product [Plutella xylostella]|uniref:(diamondback moth) hypothetical protein n=1 Tax=Plutella xylostella TaxID=51655 RepID=A0A8S4F2X5_PLUXY|nr:unnamed protein product [Plutella xylostella]